MGKQTEDKYIECPFFHYYNACKISCEGVQKESSIHLNFCSIDERKKYMKSICYFNHKKCIIAQALYKKHDTIINHLPENVSKQEV